MKIGVLIKTVKLVYAQTGIDLEKNYVSEDDIVRMINPLDEIALEYALQLKDTEKDVQVVAVACGDAETGDGLRRSLAMGADRAIHVQCEEWESLDSGAASQLLSLACKKENFNLILCGVQAIDDNDGLLGPYVAERLQIPWVSNIVSISVTDDSQRLKLQRMVEGSNRQLLESTLPVLLTVEKGTMIPRYPTLAGFIRAEESPLESVRLEGLGITKKTDLAELKLTEITRYSRPKPKRRRTSTQQTQRSAEERISYMVDGDTSMQKAGGSLVTAGSKEMFAKLDEMLREAGIFKNKQCK